MSDQTLSGPESVHIMVGFVFCGEDSFLVEDTKIEWCIYRSTSCMYKQKKKIQKTKKKKKKRQTEMRGGINVPTRQ